MLDESRHNARCRSQYSLPAKLLSKLVEIYIDENSGPMHVPPAGWITARQSHQYRIKESYNIVGRRNNSQRSMGCKALSSMWLDFHSFCGFPLPLMSQIIIGESEKGTSTIIVSLHWLATLSLSLSLTTTSQVISECCRSWKACIFIDLATPAQNKEQRGKECLRVLSIWGLKM